MKIESKNVNPPLNGEILVHMKLRPINPSDLIPIKGAYSHRITLPATPGYEGIGVVEDVGVGVSKELIGKRVLPLRGEGTWQEYVKTSADFAVPVPDSIDDYVAAQLYINPVTAWIVCTDVLELKSSDTLIVNASGSSIGRIFAQLSKVIGFRMIAVTRSDKYTNKLMEMGAYTVINTTERSLNKSVMELTNGLGVTSVIDSVGGTEGTELAFCVQPNGTFLTIGLLSGKPVDWKLISQKSEIKVKLFHLRHWIQRISILTWQQTFKKLITLITEEKIALNTSGDPYDLLDIKEAVSMSESRNKEKGKVFLTN
ncbi:zinc-dependent alcohol dehydrogenase family protein [Gracilibacillus suaedae]|uniref:zinc-dependent alcohol dehydrogenase family protein n=1 Tax=Gracilibacillus suaedae TaxID=2820273 RepID=UPI002F3F7084